MHENEENKQSKSAAVDDDQSFTVTLEQFNSAFGISADTLRALAASHNVTPQALMIRAITMWAQADIPDLDLDAPELTSAQIKRLAQRRQLANAASISPPQTLAQTFKQLLEGTGDHHENDQSSPHNGGRS